MTPAEKILSKSLAASGLPSSEWSRVQAGLRDRAFFSARVESARVLHSMRGASARVASADLSASDARKAIRDTLAREGYAPAPGEAGTIRDLASRRRLDLVLRQNVESARGYAQRQEGLTGGAFLAYPAQELVRAESRNAPRDWRARWKAAGGRLVDGGRMVALKTDPVWAAISRFGQPWPPFDYNSGMGLEDVSYTEAVRLGLVAEGGRPSPPPPEDFNAGLSAKVPFDENSREWPWLKQQFGDQIQLVGGMIQWRGNLIRDNFQKGGKFTMRLGMPSGDLIKKCAARPETEDAARMLFQKERQLVVDEGWLNKQRKQGGDHRVHFAPMPDHPESKPLEIGDCDLIPSIWRKPDRVYNAGSGSVCLEIDSLQGDVFRMIVNLSKEAPRMQTFYRTSTPYMEKQ